MISLEQVRQLDIRVKKAVASVKNLSVENNALKQRINELETQLDKLNTEASTRIASEQALEVSLQGVLDVLDEVDQETFDTEPEPPEANYVIETVSLDDDSTDDESSEGESTDEESAVEVEEPISDISETEDPETETVAGENLPLIDIQESLPMESVEEVSEELPADHTDTASPVSNLSTSETSTVAEEVPGVGQVVEFSNPVPQDEETVETDDSDTKELPSEEPAAADEEVNLDTDDEASRDGEENFQSEFEIF